MKTPIEITVRCKAFSAYPIADYKIRVYADGSVRVWDDVACHYTNVHSLSQRTCRRIAKLANLANNQ